MISPKSSPSLPVPDLWNARRWQLPVYGPGEGPWLSDDRVVVVGEANPYSDRRAFALYPDPPGAAGSNLRRIMGVPRDRYLRFGRLNLCDGAFSRDEAGRTVDALVSSVATSGIDDLLVILLGVRVADALRVATCVSLGRERLRRGERLLRDDPSHRLNFAPLAAWQSTFVGGVTWLSLPHPSGLCRAWGARMWCTGGSVERTRAALTTAAPRVPWGADGPVVQDVSP